MDKIYIQASMRLLGTVTTDSTQCESSELRKAGVLCTELANKNGLRATGYRLQATGYRLQATAREEPVHPFGVVRRAMDN